MGDTHAYICLGAGTGFRQVIDRVYCLFHRTVRAEASGVLGAMAKVVGKGLAPYLKALAGSWWLAQFDLHAEAAAAARDAFQAAFSGSKQKEALLFTRTEVTFVLACP